jgi:hypothetical protein
MEVNHCVAHIKMSSSVFCNDSFFPYVKLVLNKFSKVFHVTILLMQVKYPIYDQTVYLNDYHKKMLKDQYGKY